MKDAIIYLDASSPMGLQNQIRQRLVDGILSGAFPPGMKLPSSRKLAQQLEVARNTVVAAYHQLIADGYLVSRQRAGAKRTTSQTGATTLIHSSMASLTRACFHWPNGARPTAWR